RSARESTVTPGKCSRSDAAKTGQRAVPSGFMKSRVMPIVKRSAMEFEIFSRCSTTSARRGRITTAHGIAETPVFMPVGTQGSVKGVSQQELVELGFAILLGNTYHLHLRPGEELIRRAGGLRGFIGWDGAVLTDSGGFQVFSLRDRRKLSED